MEKPRIMKTLNFFSMKNLLVIFIFLIFCPGNLLSQQIIKFKSGNEYKVNIVSQTPDTIKYHMSSEPLVIRIALMEQVDSITTDPFWLPSNKIRKPSSIPQALSRLKIAQRVNTSGIVLGCINQVTLIANGGHLKYDKVDKPGKIMLAVTGITTEMARLVMSPVPPILLHKAEQSVMYLQQIPGNEEKFQQSLKNIRTAKYLTAAVPVLGITATVLMFVGYGHYTPEKKNGCFTAAWVLMGASLTTSIVATFYISKAKKILLDESGSISLGMNQDGVGIRFKINQ